MIWAFLSKRFRLWVLLALGVPLLRRLLGEAGHTLEQRRGESALSRSLHAGNQHLARFDRRARREARRAPRSPVRS